MGVLSNRDISGDDRGRLVDGLSVLELVLGGKGSKVGGAVDGLDLDVLGDDRGRLVNSLSLLELDSLGKRGEDGIAVSLSHSLGELGG